MNGRKHLADACRESVKTKQLGQVNLRKERVRSLNAEGTANASNKSSSQLSGSLTPSVDASMRHALRDPEASGSRNTEGASGLLFAVLERVTAEPLTLFFSTGCGSFRLRNDFAACYRQKQAIMIKAMVADKRPSIQTVRLCSANVMLL